MNEDQTITMAAAAELIRQARADEGKRNAIAEVERAWAERAELRAKVETLRREAVGREYRYAIEDVLALLDRGSDE